MATTQSARIHIVSGTERVKISVSTWTWSKQSCYVLLGCFFMKVKCFDCLGKSDKKPLKFKTFSFNIVVSTHVGVKERENKGDRERKSGSDEKW